MGGDHGWGDAGPGAQGGAVPLAALDPPAAQAGRVPRVGGVPGAGRPRRRRCPRRPRIPRRQPRRAGRPRRRRCPRRPRIPRDTAAGVVLPRTPHGAHAEGGHAHRTSEGRPCQPLPDMHAEPGTHKSRQPNRVLAAVPLVSRYRGDLTLSSPGNSSRCASAYVASAAMVRRFSLSNALMIGRRRGRSRTGMSMASSSQRRTRVAPPAGSNE